MIFAIGLNRSDAFPDEWNIFQGKSSKSKDGIGNCAFRQIENGDSLG
jgi:hypothetical protein